MEWLPLKRRTQRRKDYSVLPNDPVRIVVTRRRCRIWHGITLRRLVFCLVCTPFLVLFAILCQGIPPSYEGVRVYERRLPQHTVAALTRVDGRPARYLRFPGHLWGHGLNNILQEALLMSYLAYTCNVSFVFEDYTWSHIPLPWTVYDFALRPTHIPLNAIIAGPTAGGPMHGAPLAVSAEYYERICTSPDATPYILSSAHAPNDADGTDLITYWQSQLAHVDAQCIEIDSSAHDIFDRFFFGGPRILSLLDTLSASPILADFTWSPLIHAALARNVVLLQPRSLQDFYTSFLPTSANNATPTPALPGLIALHLRRGDYARHCPNLATWGALYMGINQHPSLPDRFDPRPFLNPTPNTTNSDSEGLVAYYETHCLPTTSQIVARLRDIKKRHPALHLQRVFILTNAWSWSLGEIRDALLADGWSDVVSSGDVVLDGEQYHVGMAVDMAIAERAEVFVGNGFSSLSSNVVMLRLAKGMDPSTNHFL